MKTYLKVLLGVVLTCASIFAQGTAQINGSIKDASGSAVPGAEIKAIQTGTGAVRTATSGADGDYALTNLPIGPYLLEVTKDGFSKYVQQGIVLNVGGNPTVDVAMKIGAVSDQVTVEADAAMVETHSVGLGTVVDNQRVVEMPLNGRNATELIFLAGMANIGGANGGFLNSVRNYPTVMISVAGGVANWITYNWDGGNHNDAYNSLNLPLIFPDALQEFKVESSALPAQYGMHASANVNVVTKSGTNDLHGNLFEFLRNGDLNARDYFATTRDTLKRNQWGGTVGGKIIKDKLFFFGGIQRTTQRSQPSDNVAYVPTAAMMQGDFTTFASAACQGTAKNLTGYTGNKIPTSEISPAAIAIQARLPQAENGCGQVHYGLLSNNNELMGVVKVDFQKSDKHTMFLRTFGTYQTAPSTYDGKNLLTLQSNAQDNRVYSLAFGDTYLLSSNLVSSFHLGINRSEIVKVMDDAASWPSLKVNAPYNPANSPRISVSGGNGFGIGSGNSIINHDDGGPNPSFNQDFSWVRGNHQFGFGGSYVHTLLNYASGINATGLMTVNGSAKTGLGLADFLIGKASTWAQGNVQGFLYNRQNYVGLYAQDTWKITSRLTMSYGVRYEPFFAFSNKYGWFDHFDQNLFNQNVHSKVYVNAPAGLIFPGDSQWEPGGNKIAKNRWNVFVPRFGMVWDPKGDGRTSVRASVGMFTDRGALYSMSAMAQDAPYGTVISLPNVDMSNPWGAYPGGNPLPLQLKKDLTFPTFASYITDNFNWKPTWVNQFNLTVQHQFGTDWLVQAAYVANTASHLITEGQINPAVYKGTAACSFASAGATPAATFANCGTTASNNYRRVLYTQNPSQGQYYGIMSTTDDGGTQSYNALFLSVQKRLNKGVSVLANYTWSHCIADLWNGNPGNNGVSSVTPFNRRNDRGNCNITDQRQVFNSSIVATVPKFQNKALRMLASDWQISPIMKLKSAQFYTVTAGVDQALNGEGGQRAQIVPGVDPYAVTNPTGCSNAPCVRWANPAAFATPALGTLGNLSNFSQKGPGVFQLDLSLSRTFPVWEKRTIQIRAEAFNLPNYVNMATPSAATNTGGTFGTITGDISGTSGLSSGDYRVVQFAMKFIF